MEDQNASEARAWHRRARSVLWLLLQVGCVLAVFGTLAGFAGNFWWVFEAAGSFRVQMFLFLLAAAVICTGTRHWGWATASSAGALINLLLVAGVYFGGAAPQKGNRTYRAVLLNLYSGNRHTDRVLAFIRDSDPDFLVLLEYTYVWDESFAGTLNAYIHKIARPRTDNFGIAVLSKYPFETEHVTELGGVRIPTVTARIRLPDGPLDIIGTHPLPPARQFLLRQRNRHLRALAERARGTGRPLMVLGDLNATPWSPAFRSLLRKGDLRDSRQGFGIHSTWPSRIWIMRVPLDHVLVSGQVDVHNRVVGPHVGSDHRGVVVEFSLASRDRSKQTLE